MVFGMLGRFSRGLSSAASVCAASSVGKGAGPRFVFLEGSAATAKSSLCKRLGKMGFAVHLEEYVSMCKKHPFVPPTSAAMSMVWGARLVQHMMDTTLQFQKDPSSIRDGIVFMDRSLLTPGIYGRAAEAKSLAFWEEIASSVDEAFDCTYVLCESDGPTQKERLFGRLEYTAQEGEEHIRRKLGEDNLDFLDHVNREYEKLAQQGVFSFRLPTTDPKQAVYILLRKLELPFTLPKIPGLESPVMPSTKEDPMVDEEFLRP